MYRGTSHYSFIIGHYENEKPSEYFFFVLKKELTLHCIVTMLLD